MNPTAAIPTISKAWPSHQPSWVKSSRSAGGECRREPDDPDGHEQVGPAPREPERAQGPPEEERVEGEARDERRPGCRAARLGNGGDERGLDESGQAESEDQKDACAEEPEQRANGGRATKRRERSEGEDRAADRKRRTSREADDAVEAHDDAGCRQAVEAEQRGHDRERTADEHGVPVALTRTGNRQGDRRHGCDAGADGNSAEMDPPADQHLVPADEVEKRGGDYGCERGEREDRNVPVSHLVCVSARIPRS